MKTNTKATDYRLEETKIAGGFGMKAAKQNAESLLRRAVMACLMWEDIAYESGASIAKNIAELIAKVDPKIVYGIAVEARMKQKLRHVPLFIAREMARLTEHKKLVGKLLPEIINRPDEIMEFMAMYWKNGKTPISKQVKVGLAAAFQKFDEYAFAKYNRDTQVKLRDVMFMVHPKPFNKEELFKKIADDAMETPDTWEVAISATKDKKSEWSRLVSEKRLGALAFMRNLRNMEDCGVPRDIIQSGFSTINPQWLLPLNYFAAAQAAPNWTREIENLMLAGFSKAPKLKGHTIFVVDVSGSMQSTISDKSKFARMDAACAMAVMASECCEHISIYATAGNDWSRIHQTQKVNPYRGFALSNEILSQKGRLGGGGIFTRQCLEYIKGIEKDADRIIVFSDSQDCDITNKVPAPFGKRNYIVDVSSNAHGINYDGVWDAEISGWSEHFLEYIMAYEGNEIAE